VAGYEKTESMDQQTATGTDADEPVYVVGGWTVDAAALRIRKDQQEVKLEPKAMAVLVYFAARPGQVVSRQDLEEAVWTDTVVGYDAISNAIIKLRKAFGDDAQNPRIIETIPKAGYRLIAPVELTAPGSAADERGSENLPPVQPVNDTTKTRGLLESSTWSNRLTLKVLLPLVLLVALASVWFEPTVQTIDPVSAERLAVPLPDKPSLAVLPFANSSGDTRMEYFADGISEDLITDLSKVKELFVIARNSVFSYKGKSIKIHRVAEELGVRYVATGSVRRDSNQVRINANLIDTKTGTQLWADRYDGSLDDVFTMQDKITQQIVIALSLTLGSGELVRQETTNNEALDAYLLGRKRYRLGTPEDLAKAIAHFKQAMELDPGFWRAQTALAATYWTIHGNLWWKKSLGVNVTQSGELSRLALEKALVQPSALAYTIASERAAFYQKRPDEALEQAELAIAADSNDPAGYLAMAGALLKADRADEAVKSIRSAMRLDPHYPASYLRSLGQAQFAMGDYQNSAESLQQATRRNPDDDWTFVYLAAAFGQLGQQQQAQQALKTANRLRARASWGEINYSTLHQPYFKWPGDRKPLREGLKIAGIEPAANWSALLSSHSRDAEDILVEGTTKIDVKMAKVLHDRGVPFVDIYHIWWNKHIPGAHNLDFWIGEFNEASLARIVDKNQEIVIYSSDSVGRVRGAQHCAMAVTWGFEKVYYLPEGSLSEWEKAGYPVETASEYFHNQQQ